MEMISEDAFEALVADALDSLPASLVALMDNVVVIVEDCGEDHSILGLYDGIPLTERDDYGGFAMPDRIFLFRQSLCASAGDIVALRDEVRVTVIHEIAHHFGIDDDRLTELGWD